MTEDLLFSKEASCLCVREALLIFAWRTSEGLRGKVRNTCSGIPSSGKKYGVIACTGRAHSYYLMRYVKVDATSA